MVRPIQPIVPAISQEQYIQKAAPKKRKCILWRYSPTATRTGCQQACSRSNAGEEYPV